MKDRGGGVLAIYIPSHSSFGRSIFLYYYFLPEKARVIKEF